MKTIKYILLFTFTFTSTILFARETKKYDFKDFKEVAVGWGMKLKIKQSDTYNVEVKADERDMKYLKVEHTGNRVEFSINKNNYRKRDDIYIFISMPELTDLVLSGGSSGKLETMNINTKNFTASLSGGSQLMGNLECGDSQFELSGGSELNIRGNGNNLEISGSGGSEFHLKDFAVKNVDCELSGGSEAAVKMNGRLNTSQSGGSELVYYGTALMGDTDFSGGSHASSGD